MVSTTIILLVIILAVFLLLLNVKIAYQQIINNREQRANNKKLEELCKGLYAEYKKVKGPEWASNALRDIVKDVVKKEGSLA